MPATKCQQQLVHTCTHKCCARAFERYLPSRAPPPGQCGCTEDNAITFRQRHEVHNESSNGSSGTVRQQQFVHAPRRTRRAHGCRRGPRIRCAGAALFPDSTCVQVYRGMSRALCCVGRPCRRQDLLRSVGQERRIPPRGSNPRTGVLPPAWALCHVRAQCQRLCCRTTAGCTKLCSYLQQRLAEGRQGGSRDTKAS